MQQYAILGPTQNKRIVECWSERRLPFDNLKDWQRKQRSELAEALKRLEANAGETLSALYISPNDNDRFDAENILFYNVGSAAFRKSAIHGLVFESTVTSAPTPVEGITEEAGRHYHRYELHSGNSDLQYWVPNGEPIRLIAHCNTPLKNDIKPATIWYALKTTGVLSPPRRLVPFSKFALLVTIKAETRTINLASIIKPVFDGIISAFHRYVGTDLEQVSYRLGERLGVASVETSALLLDDRSALLEDRTVIHLRRDGVQWNPKDDDCVAGAIYFERDPQQSSGFQIDIEVVEVNKAGEE